MAINLAIQLYSVRSLLAERLQETLRALAEIGFKHIEWYGAYGNMAPGELANFLNQIGLRVMSMHTNLSMLVDEHSRQYEYARALQPEFLSVSSNITPDNFDQTIAQLRQAQAITARHGFLLTYHNHANEFEKMPDGQTVQEALFEATAGENLQFLFDFLFAFFAGLDPCDYLRRYAGRIPQIHFNDLKPPEPQTKRTSQNGMNLSTELGTGCMNLPVIYRAAVETGVRWIVLEQHTQSVNPLESARRNFEYYNNHLVMM